MAENIFNTEKLDKLSLAELFSLNSTLSAYISERTKEISKNSKTQYSPAENEEDIFETNSENAIKGLLEKKIIYKLGNRYSICEKSSQTQICKYLYAEFFKSPNQKKFGGYISPADFKVFAITVFKKMMYAVNEDSIKKEISNFISGTKK